ncbi:hypothetical protein P171DRAFT_433631 [Karstenula rhodostoma CBS 690.94]|uniref:Uncharacterized protein n=1 Tax=Karstenula rhodostoma CBS 690.94 TaxID=1392251 RepID=A0A9P4PBN7_9PLEO|nr:hypothetical protein P171DRAFT_433631 [Karstenula rhodostoma CBS 690.94]
MYLRLVAEHSNEAGYLVGAGNPSFERPIANITTKAGATCQEGFGAGEMNVGEDSSMGSAEYAGRRGSRRSDATFLTL